jgi:hypothetical protein
VADEPTGLAADTLVTGRYRVVRTIGAGGMATVYQAVDTTTELPVAIKLLNPALTGSIGTDRFLREIALTSRLQHQLIVPILDSGTHEGSPFFVMPLIEGESLRDRLRRDKQLKVGEALRLTRDVLAALRVAHAQNIVHRDIKPANILLRGGRAIVADFGIARAYSEAAGERVTESGIAVGTPGYMSPEQASGETRLDGRADIYAVGCVLYEMLAGEPPYSGPTPQSIVAKQMSLPVPSVSVVRTSVPTALDRLLQRALAKAPADRIASAAEFDAGVEVLEHGLNAEVAPAVARRQRQAWAIAAAAALVLAGGLFARNAWRDTTNPMTLGDTTRYVVLTPQRSGVAPNVLPDLHDLLREALNRWSGITVSDSADARGARLVAATLSPAGDSLRLRVQLRESNGSVLADHTERMSAAGATTNIARAVDRLLFRNGNVPNESSTSASRSLPSRQAFAHGMRAMDTWKLATAESLFNAATTHDATYARAHLWLALARAWQDEEPASWQASASQARANAAQLTSAESQIADAIAAQSAVDYVSACAGWQRLTKADSNNAIPWFGSAHCQHKDALVIRDRASPSGWRFRSSYHRALHDYRKAFQLKPAILASLSQTQVRRLFGTGGNRVREGWSSAPDSLLFAATAEWRGDTLLYTPYELTAALPAPDPAKTDAAVRALRQQVRNLASVWVTHDPNSAAAREALAVALAELGDNSSLDTIAVARRLATDPAEKLHIDVSAIWLRLGAALAAGLPERLEPVVALADSLLAAHRPEMSDRTVLAALAALRGRGHVAAAYARRPELDDALGVPASLRESAAPLLIYSALGGPRDSLDVLERRTTAAIEAGVRPSVRPFARLGFLARPATLAYPDHRLSAFESLVRQGDWLLDLQAAYERKELAFVRDSLAQIKKTRQHLSPETIALDAILPEARLWLALGEPAAAAAWIDPTLSAVAQKVVDLRVDPVEAATLVRVVALRSAVALKLGNRQDAIRLARLARVLWSGADPYLKALLDSLPSSS